MSSNKQISFTLDPSPTIKPRALAKRNPNDLIRKLLPRNKYYNKKPIFPQCDSKNFLKTIRIKTEDSQSDKLLTTKVLTSESSTLIHNKPLKNNINKTKGYIFKNHRSFQENYQKEKETNDIKDIDLFQNKVSITEYINNSNEMTRSISKTKLANSIYYILGKRNIDRVEKIQKGLPESSIYYSMVKQRKHCLKLNPITNFLSQDKKEKVIPFGDPCPFIYNQQFENESELKRFQKINNTLLNLRYKIINNPDQEIQLLKEFLINTGIYQNSYFSIDSLNKLSLFIKSNFTIDPKNSLKMNLINVIDSTRRLDYKSFSTITFKPLTKSKGGKSANNIKETRNKNDIRLNMNLQKSLYENKALRTHIDLVNHPEETIEELRKELKHCYSNIPFRKTANNTFLIHYNNIRNRPHKLKQSPSKEKHQIDINEIRKQNKLLEYICYEKALNYSQINKCKSKVPFLQTIKI